MPRACRRRSKCTVRIVRLNGSARCIITTEHKKAVPGAYSLEGCNLSPLSTTEQHWVLQSPARIRRLCFKHGPLIRPRWKIRKPAQVRPDHLEVPIICEKREPVFPARNRNQDVIDQRSRPLVNRGPILAKQGCEDSATLFESSSRRRGHTSAPLKCAQDSSIQCFDLSVGDGTRTQFLHNDRAHVSNGSVAFQKRIERFLLGRIAENLLEGAVLAVQPC